MRKKNGMWLFIIGLVVVAGVIYNVLCQPFVAVPDLAKGLPANVEQANAEFKRRVAEAFPEGTTWETARESLAQQGFHVNETGAYFEKSGFPCTHKWFITNKDDKLEAHYGLICL